MFFLQDLDQELEEDKVDEDFYKPTEVYVQIDR